MIYFYSGTPGSGKSLRVARDIVNKLIFRRQNVITNMYVDYNYIRTSKYKVLKNKIRKFICINFFKLINKFLKYFKIKIVYNYKEKNIFKKAGRYYYLSNRNFSVDFLYKYAKKFHKRGKEGQTLLVLDEAQMLMSPSVVKMRSQEDKNYRIDLLEFFTQHRRLGYNIILVSQFDRLIDAQIRCLFEYNCIHRKVNNFSFGWILSIFRMSLFCQAVRWYGLNQRMGANFFTYKKKYSRIYDSYEFQKRN